MFRKNLRFILSFLFWIICSFLPQLTKWIKICQGEKSGINRKSRFEGKNFYNRKGLIRRDEKKIKSYNSLSSQSQTVNL